MNWRCARSRLPGGGSANSGVEYPGPRWGSLAGDSGIARWRTAGVGKKGTDDPRLTVEEGGGGVRSREDVGR